MSEVDRTKWDGRYRAEGAGRGEPSAFLVSLDEMLPREGRALDVAGGAGRNAVWLARRGLDVTVADISRVGLDLAEAAGREAGVGITTVEVDLAREGLPEGGWDVIVVVYYLERGLFARFGEVLSPGGVLVVVHPTKTNLERHARPGAAFLLEDGELPGLLGGGLRVERYEEGWFEEGRHEARLLARRAGGEER